MAILSKNVSEKLSKIFFSEMRRFSLFPKLGASGIFAPE